MTGPLLLVHIAGGSAALVSGAAALSFRKGGRLHGQAGTIFFTAMLVMTSTGGVIAALAPQRGTMLVAIFTAYLVLTSWRAARRRDGGTGRFELIGCVVATLCAAAFLGAGLYAMTTPTGRLDSLPAAVHFPFAALAALAASLDLNFILRRERIGIQRIARHVWRMSTAFLITAFSFFLGQQKVMPVAWHGSPLLFIPPLAVLASMIFWLLRVRFAKVYSCYAPRRRRPADKSPDFGSARIQAAE
jgi:uncharacterized membrane protein